MSSVYCCQVEGYWWLVGAVRGSGGSVSHTTNESTGQSIFNMYALPQCTPRTDKTVRESTLISTERAAHNSTKYTTSVVYIPCRVVT